MQKGSAAIVTTARVATDGRVSNTVCCAVTTHKIRAVYTVIQVRTIQRQVDRDGARGVSYPEVRIGNDKTCIKVIDVLIIQSNSAIECAAVATEADDAHIISNGDAYRA